MVFTQNKQSLISKIIITTAFLFTAVFASAQAPQVQTDSSSFFGRDADSVELQGSVTLTAEFPFGKAYFEYGRTTAYGSRTSDVSMTTSGSFTQVVNGLNEDTSYHFRSVLLASDGTIYNGADKTFITPRETDPSFGNNNDDDDDENNSNNNSNNNNSSSASSSTTTSEPAWEEQDLDQDGVSNGEECGAGGRSACADTDSDGDFDYEDTDSDGDSVLDADEEEGQRTEPTFTEPESGSENTQDLGNQEPAGSQGGGSLIPNGRGVPTGSTNTDPNFNTPDGLVPDCGESGCGYNDVIQLIQNLINWMIWMSIILATASIVYIGVKYLLAGSGDAKSEAKKMLWNVAKGMFWVLAGWLVINTILTTFLRDEVLEDPSVNTLGVVDSTKVIDDLL